MFEFWKNMFKLERITAEKLKEVVEKGFITEEEFKTITGKEYIK